MEDKTIDEAMLSLQLFDDVFTAIPPAFR